MSRAKRVVYWANGKRDEPFVLQDYRPFADKVTACIEEWWYERCTDENVDFFTITVLFGKRERTFGVDVDRSPRLVGIGEIVGRGVAE